MTSREKQAHPARLDDPVACLMAVLESESCYPDKQFQGLSERKDGEMATTFGINTGCDKGLEDECKSGP